MPFHSCTFWRTSYACMDGKFDLKRWIMYFHIIPKWNQQQTAPPQFTKALLHLYSCYFIMMIKSFCICIFPWKREKSSLMIVIKNVPFYRIFETLLNSMYKGKFMVTPFHLHFTFSKWCCKADLCITIYLLGIREFKHFKWIIMYIFKARQMVMKSTCAFKTACFILIDVGLVLICVKSFRGCPNRPVNYIVIYTVIK